MLGELRVNLHELPGGFLPGEGFCLLEACCNLLLASGWIGEQIEDVFCPGGFVGGGEGYGRISHHLRQGRSVGAEHGYAAAHRFQDRNAEAFVQAGHDEQVGTAVQRGQVVVVHKADEMNTAV